VATAEVWEHDIQDLTTTTATLETIIDCGEEKAHNTFSRRGVLHSFCTSGTKKPAEAGFPFPPES